MSLAIALAIKAMKGAWPSHWPAHDFWGVESEGENGAKNIVTITISIAITIATAIAITTTLLILPQSVTFRHIPSQSVT